MYKLSGTYPLNYELKVAEVRAFWQELRNYIMMTGIPECNEAEALNVTYSEVLYTI